MTLALGITLLAAPGMRGQTAPAAAPSKPAAKSGTKSAPKAHAKTGGATARKVSDKQPTASEQKIARRDPFESMVNRQKDQGAGDKNLPPGKPGLQVGTLRLDGIVKSNNGMIAVVANPQQRTYFLREGDKLFDGTVEKISMEGVTFHEEGKDAFGKPVERQVNKRLYSSAGEQQ